MPNPHVSRRETLNLPADGPDELGTPRKVAGGLMNHSIYSADRSTHLKIVVVALVAGIVVAGLSISARSNSDDGYTQTARVIKAGKPVVITNSNTSMVR
jgi:hypothetical protein